MCFARRRGKTQNQREIKKLRELGASADQRRAHCHGFCLFATPSISKPMSSNPAGMSRTDAGVHARSFRLVVPRLRVQAGRFAVSKGCSVSQL